MSSTYVERPGSVSAVVFLTWLAAALDIIGGLVLVAFAGTEEVQELTGASSGTLTTAGWTTLIIGVIVAVVAIRLGEGSSGARMLVTVLMLVRVGAGIWVLVVTGSHGATESLVTVVVSAAVLYLLWTGPASDYFAARS
jgi:hypothetical protein